MEVEGCVCSTEGSKRLIRGFKGKGGAVDGCNIVGQGKDGGGGKRGGGVWCGG